MEHERRVQDLVLQFLEEGWRFVHLLGQVVIRGRRIHAPQFGPRTARQKRTLFGGV